MLRAKLGRFSLGPRGASPRPSLPPGPAHAPGKADTLTESLSPSHVTLEHGVCHGQDQEPPLCHSPAAKTCDGNLVCDSHTQRVQRFLWILITGTGVSFCPSMLIAGTSAGGGGGGRVFLSAPRLSRVVPWTRATSAEGGFRGKACPSAPSLPRSVCAEGERLVSHCVYCGFLWRHADHFWPTTLKSCSLNGHCHRPVVAQ